MIIQLLINGLINGLIYSLVAMGFALVYNTTKTFHIAYSAIYMIPPYIFLTFNKKLELNFFLSAIIAILTAVVVSIIVELFVYKPLVNKKSSKNVITVSSIGVMIILINLIALIYGNETKILQSDISNTANFLNITVTYTQIYQFIIAIIIIGIFWMILKKTNFGIIVRGISDNKKLSLILGLNLSFFRIFLFALSGFFAASGSLLIAYDVGMDPYVGMPMFLNVVVAMIIGGIGDFRGPILGGMVIGLLQAVVIWFASSQWQTAITFFILIIFLLFRPQGILGKKLR